MSGFAPAPLKNEGSAIPNLAPSHDAQKSAAHSLAIAHDWIENAYSKKGAVLPGTQLDYELTEIRKRLKGFIESLRGEKEQDPVMQRFLKDTDQDHG